MEATMDKVTLMESVLASIEDHHDRGDESVTASDIAMALGVDKREVRGMMNTLVGSGHLAACTGWHPNRKGWAEIIYFVPNYEEVE